MIAGPAGHGLSGPQQGMKMGFQARLLLEDVRFPCIDDFV